MRPHPQLPAFVARNRTEPVLSAYITIPAGAISPLDVARIALHHGLASVARTLKGASHSERGAFDECSTQFRERIGEIGQDDVACTWMAFATVDGGVTSAVVPGILPPRLGTTVAWDIGAHVAPMLALLRAPSRLVVLADREHAVFFRLEHGEVTELTRFETKAKIDVGSHMSAPPAPHFHTGTRGTPATDSAARQADSAYERHRGKIIDAIRTQRASEPILLGGVGETTARIVAELPHDLRDRVGVSTDLHFETTVPEMCRIAASLDAQDRMAFDDAAVEHALARARSAPTGVLGAGPAHIALGQSAVGELLVSITRLERDPEFVEDLVREAVAQNANVRIVRFGAAAALDAAAAGVAAELRFPIAPVSNPSLTT